MKANFLLFGASIVGYTAIAYAIPRPAFEPFIGIYMLLFLGYFYWCANAEKLYPSLGWKTALLAALVFRVVFLWATPELSDDFWRYLWDGRLLNHGINPYQFLPKELLEMPIYEEAHLAQLYPYLNSPEFYSVYPPIAQMFFAAATFFFDDNAAASVVALSTIVLCLEMGTIVLLGKLLKALKKPTYFAFLYAFNPLIIIELSGNLHTESIMIFFLVLALYTMVKGARLVSAFSFAMAVGAKILPLILMPLILHRLWFKKGLIYCAIVGFINLCLVLLFFDIELLQKITTSVRLYFAHFEFNASVYYIFRYGLLDEYWKLWDYYEYFKGFSPIEDLLRMDWFAGLRRVLPVLDVVLIFILSFQKKVRHSIDVFFNTLLFVYSLHFFLVITVHPWYISTLVLLTALTSYRYALWWTALIGLTYITYSVTPFAENTVVILIEYGLLFLILSWELRQQRQQQKQALT